MMETLLVDPFATQTTSSICFKLCLMKANFSQQEPQYHQQFLKILLVIFCKV
jgi:hypothetical protein